jgi:putative ABC transport system permease protein
VLGRSIRVGRLPASPVYEIVGVVSDARSVGTHVEVLNEVYTPFAQDRASYGCVILHSPLDRGALSAAVRDAVRAIAPDLALRAGQGVRTLDELLAGAVAKPRFSATLFGAFSAVALLLAVIGVFGLVAYSLSQRQRELGVRAALGARPADLLATAMRSAVLLTAIGVAAGLLTGAYVTRFVEGELYGVEPLDVPTFVIAAAAMLVSAAVAAYVPARRAIAADPMVSLRYE